MARKMDIKKLAVAHTEKVVFALAAVFGLWVLWGANWQPYPGKPAEIEQKVADGRNRLAANTWPKAEQDKFVVTRDRLPANLAFDRLMKPIPPDQYDLPAKMVYNPWVSGEPITEPKWLAPRNPIADPSQVLIEVTEAPADPAATPAAQPEQLANTPPASEDSIPDRFKPNTGPRNTAAPGRGGAGPAVGGLTVAAAPPPEVAQQQNEYLRMLEMAEQAEAAANNPEEEELAAAYDAIRLVNARSAIGKGYSFVAVRAVFPLREQLVEYANAIHKSYNEVAREFLVVDFNLERRELLPDGVSWSDWGPVDLNIAQDVLKESNGLELDPVDSAVTDPVVTMPLPARLTGQWDKLAKHDLITNFVLDETQMDLLYEFNKVAFLEMAKQRHQAPVVAPPRTRGGFVSFTANNRDTVANLVGVQNGYALGATPAVANDQNLDSVVAKLADYIKSDDPVKQKELIKEWLKGQINSKGQFLLFRYFDFGVVPGKTYQYRVQFVLANPNFGKPLAYVGGNQFVVEGETRDTPFSDPTPPVTVEEEIRFFAKSVSDSGTKAFPTAAFEVFEWSKKWGTFINVSLANISLGQYIAGRVNTTVIDAAKNVLNENEPHDIVSQDFLVDLADPVKINARYHSAGDELAITLPTGLGGRLGFAAQALVRNEFGEFEYLDLDKQKSEYEQAKKYMGYQETQFANLKPQKTDVAGGGGANEEMMRLLYGEGSAPSQNSRRSKRVRRLNP